MPKRWTKKEESFYRTQIRILYINQNKTISEIAKILNIGESSVGKRLHRLGIETVPTTKLHYCNRRTDVVVPSNRSNDLAEFFGIMLGDGHLTSSQVCVTLGTKEISYARHVAHLYQRLFGVLPRVSVSRKGYVGVCLSSVIASKWLSSEGLVYNKVKSQVDVPGWVFRRKIWIARCVRGFFDTDGSIYSLRFGIQLSFTNASRPLLSSLQRALKQLLYKVSEISGPRFYITRFEDIERFFTEIGPQNKKHLERYRAILQSRRRLSAGDGVVNRSAL